VAACIVSVLAACGGGSGGGGDDASAPDPVVAPDDVSVPDVGVGVPVPVLDTDPSTPETADPDAGPADPSPPVPDEPTVPAPSDPDPAVDPPPPELDTPLSGVLPVAPVPSAVSPIEGTRGVTVTLDAGTTLSLFENTDADDSDPLQIMADPDLTDGDLSNVVGEAFLQFRGADAARQPRAVIRSETPLLAIFACSDDTGECESVAVSPVDGESIAFDVDESLHYVIERAPR